MTPSPLVLVASTEGGGSTFNLALGTPPQRIKVAASFSHSELQVPLALLPLPLPAAVNNGNASSQSNSTSASIDSGGLSGVFLANASSTWTLFNASGSDTRVVAGSDVLWNAWPNGTVSNITIANVTGMLASTITNGSDGGGSIIASLGLGTQKGGSTGLLQGLKNLNVIPSLSFSYTAASRLHNSSASLVLGGYFRNRFVDAKDTIQFKLQDSPTSQGGGTHPPAVMLTAITIAAPPVPSPSPPSSSPTLTNQRYNRTSNGRPVLAILDPSSPYLTLPRYMCELFVEVLGLFEDATSHVFYVNDTMQSQPRDSPPSVALVLADDLSKKDRATLELSYLSLILVKGHVPLLGMPEMSGHVGEDEKGQPVRQWLALRASLNDSEATIGEPFFQETHLIVDYERKGFLIHQSLFPAAASTELGLGPDSNLVTIKPLSGPLPGWWIIVRALFIAAILICVPALIIGAVWNTQKARKRKAALRARWERAHTFDYDERMPYSDDFLKTSLGLGPSS